MDSKSNSSFLEITDITLEDCNGNLIGFMEDKLRYQQLNSKMQEAIQQAPVIPSADMTVGDYNLRNASLNSQKMPENSSDDDMFDRETVKSPDDAPKSRIDILHDLTRRAQIGGNTFDYNLRDASLNRQKALATEIISDDSSDDDLFDRETVKATTDEPRTPKISICKVEDLNSKTSFQHKPAKPDCGVPTSSRPNDKSQSPIVRTDLRSILPHLKLPSGTELFKRPVAQAPKSSSSNQRQNEIETTSLPSSTTLLKGAVKSAAPARSSSNCGIKRFPVPQVKPVSTTIVDLTEERDVSLQRHPVQSQGRVPHSPRRLICHICHKCFSSTQEMDQHRVCRRVSCPSIISPYNLIYQCFECSAQFNMESRLLEHHKSQHSPGSSSPELAMPVIDSAEVGALQRLTSIGILLYPTPPSAQFLRK